MPEVVPDTSLQEALNSVAKPRKDFHKGQNGRLLVVGGSRIFHAAALWSAEIASRFVDLVHFSSTRESQEIFVNLKSKFINGIVIPQDQIPLYVAEDDCILIGPGMERGDIPDGVRQHNYSFQEILEITDEAQYTFALIKFLIHTYPHKKFVFDAAALQMLEPEWLQQLHSKAIVTPHAKEFNKLFSINIDSFQEEEIERTIKATAQKYSCVILLKRVIDYVSDGSRVVKIIGGNEGLTKGGTGDALAGLAAAFNTRSDQVFSCILSSYLVKATAEKLYDQTASYYNTSDLIASIPAVAKAVLY